MTLFPFQAPPELLFRIGRQPDPWQPPDWALAADDGTFGNRFDDPQRVYRVLYASSQRLGCYLETLARFRVDLKLLAELQEINGDDDFVPLGSVPLQWCAKRVVGSAKVTGRYADIYASEWIGHFRVHLADLAVSIGALDLDAALLQVTQPRNLTQHISRVIYENGFDGAYYRSKYGHDIQNWALFEPFILEPQSSMPILQTDPDLLTALRIHALRLSNIVLDLVNCEDDDLPVHLWRLLVARAWW